MIQSLAKIALAGPLTVYYGYQSDNRLVRYGMYALGAGMIAQGMLSLYAQTRAPGAPQQIGRIEQRVINGTINTLDREAQRT